jgi:hypothetical protein
VRVVGVRRFGADELLATLRRTRLRGYGGVEPYADASLELVAGVDPEELAPAQNYVLRAGVDTALALRAALLERGVDPLALDGGLRVATVEAPDEWVPLLPPVVEESTEPDGRTVLLVNDGMHRLVAARELGLPVSVVVVRGVPAAYPYYAFALPGGWADVAVLPELPDGHQKKNYRQPVGYKALYRDFDALFPGVQRQRRRTNPSHLVG